MMGKESEKEVEGHPLKTTKDLYVQSNRDPI